MLLPPVPAAAAAAAGAAAVSAQIYNECIHDLLAPAHVRVAKPAALRLKEDKAGHIAVQGLSEVRGRGVGGQGLGRWWGCLGRRARGRARGVCVWGGWARRQVVGWCEEDKAKHIIVQVMSKVGLSREGEGEGGGGRGFCGGGGGGEGGGGTK